MQRRVGYLTLVGLGQPMLYALQAAANCHSLLSLAPRVSTRVKNVALLLHASTKVIAIVPQAFSNLLIFQDNRRGTGLAAIFGIYG
jgi:hypothetical protein